MAENTATVAFSPFSRSALGGTDADSFSRHGCQLLQAAWMRLLHCFSWSFFAEKTPRLKIGTEADFKPIDTTHHFLLY